MKIMKTSKRGVCYQQGEDQRGSQVGLICAALWAPVVEEFSRGPWEF